MVRFNLQDSTDKQAVDRGLASIIAALSLDPDAPVGFSAEGKIDDGQHAGVFKISSAADSAGAVELKAEQVPLAIFGWLARRVYDDLNLAGDLACELVWQPAGERQALRGQLGLTRLLVSGGPLQGDKLAIADLMAAGDVTLDGQRAQFKELTVDCELGRARRSRRIRRRRPARIGNRLGHRAREVHAGWLARPRPAQPHAAWDSPRATRHPNQRRESPVPLSEQPRRRRTPLAGAAGNRRVGGNQRRSAGALGTADHSRHRRAGRQEPASLLIRSPAAANFLQLTGKGTAADLSADLQFNLDQLKADVGQLIDLGQTQLAGDVEPSSIGSATTAARFASPRRRSLKDFAARGRCRHRMARCRPLRRVRAAGRMTADAVDRLDSGVLRIMAAGEGGASDLLEVHLARSGRRPRGTCRSDRSLPRLSVNRQSRPVAGSAGALGGLAGWNLRERSTHMPTLPGRPQSARFTRCRVRSTVSGYERHVVHRRAGRTIRRHRQYDAASRRVELANAKIESSTASITCDKASIAFSPAGSVDAQPVTSMSWPISRSCSAGHTIRSSPPAIVWSGQFRRAAPIWP